PGSTRAVLSTWAAGRRLTRRSRRASATFCSPTRTSPRNRASPRRRWRSRTSSRSWAPGWARRPDLAAAIALPAEPSGPGAAREKPHLEPQLVAGLDRPPELRGVDADHLDLDLAG